MKEHSPLPSGEVIFYITPEELRNTPERDTDNNIIGQPRAQKALEMGIEIKTNGFNIFVTGIPGTGRNAAVQKVLNAHLHSPFSSKDIAYVYNFKNPESPAVLYFLPGEARQFRKALADTLENIKSQIIRKLEGPGYKKIRNDIVSALQEHERKVLQSFENRLEAEGFISISDGADETLSLDIGYLFKGVPQTMNSLFEAVEKKELTEEQYKDIQKRYFILKDELQSIFRALLRSKNEMRSELNALRVITVTPEIYTEIAGCKIDYPDPRIQHYLDDIADDITENLELFLDERPSENHSYDTSKKSSAERYDLNILEDRSEQKSAPVVFENHPTYKNLFGSIDWHRRTTGEIVTDYRNIRGGSFLRASGGFLILQAESLFNDDRLWEHLKRTLKTGKVSILPLGNRGTDIPQILKPEDIEVDVKVILVGNENLYDILYMKDPDFYSYFKISAEFDSVMPRNTETTGQYIQFMNNYCEEQSLLPLDDAGRAEVIRFGTRLAEDRSKLSTRFSSLRDLLVEADYWAQKEGRKTIDARIVRKTQEERQYLNNLPEEKINEMIAVGDIIIPVSGKAVGLVNALAIQDRGYLSFGTPCLISSQTSPGDSGIINIEGEVGLSGEIHDKWLMMLEGYLRHNYASRIPLSLHCTICFEQSYGEVDGDSAASAELYAILSSIAQIPVRQDLAVTGSISQTGLVQAIGGATEKIEGFFDICSCAGLTGTQGVIIPRQNIKNLILSERVENAIKEKNFHIYPVATINEGLEVLTGMPAGEKNLKGSYPPGTFNHQVEKQLKLLHSRSKPAAD